MATEAPDDFFELIDLVSGNVLDDFDDRESAFATLHRLASGYGLEAVRRLSLMHIQGDDESLVALGDSLVALLTPVQLTHQPAHKSSAGRIPSQESWRRAFQLQKASSHSWTIAQTQVRYERLRDSVHVRPAPKVTATVQMVLDRVA